MELFIILTHRMESIHVFENLYIFKCVSCRPCRPKPPIFFLSGCFVGIRGSELFIVFCNTFGLRRTSSLLSLNITTICSSKPYEFRSRASMKDYQSPARSEKQRKGIQAYVAWFAWGARVGESVHGQSGWCSMTVCCWSRYHFTDNHNWMRKVFQLGLSSLNSFFLCKYFFYRN